MKNFKNIKKIVKELLEADRLLADNDKKLTWLVWQMYFKELGLDISIDVIDYSIFSKLPKESTITRARRQLESMYPALRGDSYTKRKNKLESEAREIVTEEKWTDLGEIINNNYGKIKE